MRLFMTALAVAGAMFGTSAMGQQQAGGDIMSRLDTNGDGKISLDEYQAFAEMRWTRMANGADKIQVVNGDARAKRVFAGITPDADGNVTHAAYIAAQPAAFKKADTNGDGSLDLAELAASFPMRRPAPPATAPAQ